MELINNFKKVVEDIKAENSKLLLQLSDCDKKEQDVLHFIEFGTFNASEGYKLTEALKKIRGERRAIKNDLDRITKMFSFARSAPPTDMTNGSLCNRILNKISTGEAQLDRPKTYTPNLITSEQILGRTIKMS